MHLKASCSGWLLKLKKGRSSRFEKRFYHIDGPLHDLRLASGSGGGKERGKRGSQIFVGSISQ